MESGRERGCGYWLRLVLLDRTRSKPWSGAAPAGARTAAAVESGRAGGRIVTVGARRK